MPSAGAVCPPVITPLRRAIYGQSTTKIDTSTLIEINCETPNTKIYFTADGTKPNPHQRKVGGREVVFRYTAPFTLKDGKRTLKAIAITRDGLKESDVIAKTYVVEDVNKINSSPIPFSSTDVDTTDVYDSDDYDYTDSTLISSKSSKSSKASKGKTKKDKKDKKSKSPTRNLRSRSKSPMRLSGPKEAWASGSYSNLNNSGAFGDDSPPPPVPEGPFTATNYSGTQINVWGGVAPPFVQGGTPGSVNLGQPGICNPYTTQYGYLTENMLQNCNPETKHVTVGDLRQLLQGHQRPPPQPAVTAPPTEVQRVEVPTYKNPPLNPVSPGGGRVRRGIKSFKTLAPVVTFASHPKPFT